MKKGYWYAAAAALGCFAAAAPLAAQSLSRVQILALQQQLRDDGCGISHVTGRIDGITRSAIKKCASKYNASGTDAAAVLTAMNIGFGANDGTPSVSTARSGTPTNSMGGTLPSTPTTPSTPEPPAPTPAPTPMPTTPAPNPPVPTTPSTPAPPTTPTPPNQ